MAVVLIIPPRPPTVVIPAVHVPPTQTTPTVETPPAVPPVPVVPLTPAQKTEMLILLVWFLVLGVILTMALFSFEQRRRRIMGLVLLGFLALSYLAVWIIRKL